jgi:hypothetical protein
MIGFDPSRHLPSNNTANFRTVGFIGSGSVLLLYSAFKNSRAKLMKMMSDVMPLVNSSYSLVLIYLKFWGLCSLTTSIAISAINAS